MDGYKDVHVYKGAVTTPNNDSKLTYRLANSRLLVIDVQVVACTSHKRLPL